MINEEDLNFYDPNDDQDSLFAQSIRNFLDNNKFTQLLTAADLSLSSDNDYKRDVIDTIITLIEHPIYDNPDALAVTLYEKKISDVIRNALSIIDKIPTEFPEEFSRLSEITPNLNQIFHAYGIKLSQMRSKSELKPTSSAVEEKGETVASTIGTPTPALQAMIRSQNSLNTASSRTDFPQHLHNIWDKTDGDNVAKAHAILMYHFSPKGYIKKDGWVASFSQRKSVFDDYPLDTVEKIIEEALRISDGEGRKILQQYIDVINTHITHQAQENVVETIRPKFS